MTTVYFITIRHESDEWSHEYELTMSMEQKELDLVKRWKAQSDELSSWHYDLTIVCYKIATKITRKQLEKFEDVMDSWQVITAIMDNWDGLLDVAKDNCKRYFVDYMEPELELSKWNPRSVLGKLEFDRRAKEAGIEWSDA